MMKKLIHIALIFLIAVIGIIQVVDNHPIYGNDEIAFSSCETDGHGHDDYKGVHICFLLRRNNLNEYLISEQIIIEYSSLNQILPAEDVIHVENRLDALFLERSPPA